MVKTLVNLLISTVAVIITAYVLPGVKVEGFVTALLVAIFLGVINTFIRPVFILLTLPLNVLTFGLFTFVINALMVMLVSSVVPGFVVSSFWWALLFSLILSVVSAILHWLL